MNHAQHPTADDPRNHSAAIVEGTGNKCNGSLLLQHRDKLRRLSPDTEATRRVQNLVEARRKLVDEKTAQTNRLTSHLNIYFPQMLDWFERLDTGLVCALLECWPTLEELQKVPPAKLRMFFQKYHCRDHELIERRILAIRQAIPAIRDRAVIEADSALVKVIVQVIRSLVAGIATLDEKVEEAATAHPDFFIFDSLPGAGAALAPRLLAAFGSQRERYSNAGEVQSYSGIAPVMESSGKKQWVHSAWPARSFCDKVFTNGRVTPSRTRCGHEATTNNYVAEAKYTTPPYEHWLLKWIRVVFRCWKDAVAYDESNYLASLARRGSPLSAIVATGKTL